MAQVFKKFIIFLLSKNELEIITIVIMELRETR